MKTIVITGGTKGIGLEITKLFLKKKYFVVVGSRNKIKIDTDNSKNLIHIVGDASNIKFHEKLASKAKSKTGRIDAYINNVGYSEWRPIQKIDKKFLINMITQNLLTNFYGCKIATKYFNKKGGSIINISSIAGKRGTKNNSAYCASKFGLNGMTQALSKELGPKNIKVNALCPVLIKTPGLIKALENKYSPSNGNIDNFFKNFTKNNTALNRLPSALDVANMCFYLCSPENSSITGQCINIDCGVLPQ